MNRAKIEYLIATCICVTLLILLALTGLRARAAVRDDLRRTDITNLKRAAEMYFNQHDFYPSPPESGEITNGTPPVCTSSEQENSWLFGNSSPLLREGHINAIPHDVRETKGRVYMYCATRARAGETQGYFFQAHLEEDQPDEVNFDDDETRKFTYRILHENGQVLYRVCGGTETQCQLETSQ